MKFRVDTLPLGEKFGWTTNDGTPIYVKVPIGVTEGFVKELSDIGDEDKGGRQGNLKVIDLVTEWNFDDAQGKTLPLTSTIKPEADGGAKGNDKKRLAILAELPIELPGYLAKQAVAASALTEDVEGFSKTSSGSS